MAAWNKYVRGVVDVVAEVEQRERALMGEERIGNGNGHPCLAHVVMLDGGEALDAVQPPAYALKAPAAYMVLEKLATDPMPAGLGGVEIAALLIGLGLEPEHVWCLPVLHRQSIA